jgi:hypothetical protein
MSASRTSSSGEVVVLDRPDLVGAVVVEVDAHADPLDAKQPGHALRGYATS